MQVRRLTRQRMLAVGGAAAGAALVGGPSAFAADGDQGIAGSWHSVVTFTNPPLGAIDSLLTLGEDGTAVESRRLYVAFTPVFGPLLSTTGHGSWSKRRGRTR